MKALEDEAVKKAEEKKQTKEDSPGEPKAAESESPVASPADKAQRNFTDPNSRIMKVSSTKSFDQCYNGQAIVDDSFQVIVVANLSQKPNDKEEVEPMLDVLEDNLGKIRAWL